MRLRQAALAISSRVRRPTIWGSCLAWTVMTMSGYMISEARLDASHFGVFVPVLKVMSNLSDAVIVVILAPFAWQWTGDDRPLEAPWRGVLQDIGIVAMGILLLKLPLVALLPHEKANSPDPLGIAMVILHASAVLIVTCIVGWAIAWSERQEELRRQALAQVQEAQWTLLRSQLSPHLVLNALNELAGLVEEDPARAARGLEDLAEVYQRLLAMGEIARLPLVRERELLERYLGVEQLRLEANLKVTWHWDPGLDDIHVPPLLLQPLVENAIKHGINASPDGGRLEIYARRAGSMIALEVSNTGGSLHLRSPQISSGVGIRNLKSRLGLVYGELATLSLCEDGEWTRAMVLIPASATSAPGDRP